MSFWQRTTTVAKLAGLDPVEFTNWAMMNRERYGIVMEKGGEPEVNQWFLEEIVENYRRWKALQQSETW